MPASIHRWTPAEDRQIWESLNLPAKTVAATLGVSTAAVQKRRSHLGARAHRRPPPIVVRITKLALA